MTKQEVPETGAKLPRISGAPEEIYQAPRHGDPLSLAALRTHLGRCRTCATGVGCGDFGQLVNGLDASRRYWGCRR